METSKVSISRASYNCIGWFLSSVSKDRVVDWSEEIKLVMPSTLWFMSRLDLGIREDMLAGRLFMADDWVKICLKSD